MPYQLHRHVDYVEVRLEGVIEAALKYDEIFQEVGEPFRRVLVDFTGVTQVRVDAYTLAEQAKKHEDSGLRVALYMPRPALFGIGRQVLQLGLVHEGLTAAVFKDLDEATEWLRSG